MIYTQNMGSFRVLPHTADTKIKIEGKTPQDLFRTALLGMNYILVGDKKSEYEDKQIYQEEIRISSNNNTSLLIDFLSEVLTKTQIKKIIFNKVIFKQLTERNLIAIIQGRQYSSLSHDIKAVTYHEADIKKNKKGLLETVVVFDI
jgi:SHS2 domain-containing protein